MTNTDLSILIATCDRPGMLRACISSILTQKLSPSYEIIILDQSDPEKKYSPPPHERRIKVVPLEFKNKSRALNLGVAIASSEHIAVIDDDCIAHEQWLASMRDALLSEPEKIITGRVMAGEIEEKAIRSRLHDALEERIVYQRDSITPIFKLSGCNFGFSKSTYKTVGPFNEKFGPGSIFKSSDDNEWSYRALHQGLKIVYQPQIIVFHRSWRDRVADAKLMKDYGYAAGAFFGLISTTSSKDLVYHSASLWRWLLSNILSPFNPREAVNHLNYAIHFVRGFRAFHHHGK